MKIFVTGATGFIGSHVLNAALSAGHEVVAVRRSPDARPRVPLVGEPVWLERGLGKISADDLAGCQALLHLAAAGVTPQPATWRECYQVNVLESLALVQRAVEAGISRVVATGTYAEYGKAGLRFDPIPPDAPLEPTDPYAASKASAGIALGSLCREQKFTLVYARLFSVYGEGQFEKNFWPELRRAALAGDDFPMTEGGQIRDFVPVERVARLLVHACTRVDLNAGEPLVVNLASGQPTTLRDFAVRCWKDFAATGRLLPGAIPSRPNEIQRYVPLITDAPFLS